MRDCLLIRWQAESLSDVAVRVERSLANLGVISVPYMYKDYHTERLDDILPDTADVITKQLLGKHSAGEKA